MNTYKLPTPERGEFTAPNKPVPAGYVQELINLIAIPGGAQGWGDYDLYGSLSDIVGHYYAVSGTSTGEVSITRDGAGAVKILYAGLDEDKYTQQQGDKIIRDLQGPYEYILHDNLVIICSAGCRPYIVGVRNMGYDPTPDAIAARAGEAPYNVRGSAPVFSTLIVDNETVRVGQQSVIAAGYQHNLLPKIKIEGDNGTNGTDAEAHPVMTLDGMIADIPGSGYPDGVYTWKLRTGTYYYGAYNNVVTGTDLQWNNDAPLEVTPNTNPPISPHVNDIGKVIRIESEGDWIPGEYVITGVNGSKWVLETQPSVYNGPITGGVWSMQEGPGSVLASGVNASVSSASKYVVKPGGGYIVSEADINKTIHFIGGDGWDKIPAKITAITTAEEKENGTWTLDRSPADTDKTGGQWVIRGSDVARDAKGTLTVSGGKITSVTVTDEGKFLSECSPVNPVIITSGTWPGGGSGAVLTSRLKVSGLYVYKGGSGYKSTPKAYAYYGGDNGPRAKQGGAGPLAGRYEYAVTYRYKDNTGKIIYESGLSQSFWSVNLNNSSSAHIQGIGRGNIWTSGEWAGDNDYELRPYPTHIVIYRRGGNVGVFRECIEIPWEAADSGRVYVDNKPDADLGQLCTTEGTIPPPKGTRYVQHHARRMWYAAGAHLYASKQDEPWVCSNDSNPTLMTAPIRFTIEDGADITGLVSVDRVLVVFTANGAYRIDGTTAQDFRVTKIEASGCNMHGSARSFRGGVIWHSERGVEYWRNGYGVEHIGEAIGPLWSSTGVSHGYSAVFTHNGIEMYGLYPAEDSDGYMRLFSGTGWSRITKPAGEVLGISGFAGGLRVVTTNSIYKWPHDVAGGAAGVVTWPMNDYGSAMNVKSVIGVRALIAGTQTPAPYLFNYRVDFRNPETVFTGTAVTPAAKTYGNHVLHQRLRGVYGYELQPILNVNHMGTDTRVHGLELDIVTRGLAR